MHAAVTKIKKNLDTDAMMSRPAPIDRALYLARDTAPHLTDLAEMLIPRMPKRPTASPNIRCITRIRHSDPLPLAVAIHQPWMAMDSDTVRNVLAIDVDHADGITRADEVARAYRLPRPTVIADPWTGRSHAVWILTSPVCTGAAGRQGPQLLADLACRLLAAAMGGTPMPRHALIKSPWGLSERVTGTLMHRVGKPACQDIWEAYEQVANGLVWHTAPGELRAVELREVVAALADDYGEEATAKGTRRAFRRNRGEVSAIGRNCALFDAVRYWAYDHAESDCSAIEAEARRINADFRPPLPGSEVAATARSIARFMCQRFKGGLSPSNAPAIRRRRDTDMQHLDVTERQAIAGIRSSQQRTASTDAKIIDAIARLWDLDEPITQTILMRETGCGERTIRRRWSKCVGQGNRPFAVISGSRGFTAPQAGDLDQKFVAQTLAELAKDHREAVATRRAAVTDDRASCFAEAQVESAPESPTQARPELERPIETPSETPSTLPVATAAAISEVAVTPVPVADLTATITTLATFTTEMRQRGARPSYLPDVPRHLSSDPTIRAALAAAKAALKDAERRDRKRFAKREAEEQQIEFREQAARGAEGRKWFAERLDHLRQYYDHLIAEADDRERGYRLTQKEADIRGKCVAWKNAVRYVQGLPPRRRLPPVRDNIEAEIPF